ncbi:MAG: hypothetical protein SFU25_08085, partial [Candidatus Caenarcaniphilales bacterium]|nr:hypothetical protein [Candidatus Caenarcaniphilales bacterium]
MKAARLTLSVFLIVLLSFSSGGSFAKSLKEIYRDSSDSVMLLIANVSDDKFATGTAFAIDSEGTFLTAYHVIEE